MNHAQKVQRARQGASRKKGKLKKRPKNTDAEAELPPIVPVVDSNAEVVLSKSKEEKEAERREKIRQEVAAQANSKWNAKKKKRLDKYIEKKLKKEERVQIFEKLAQSQAEIPSSLYLQSSASLGTGKAITHQERFDHIEDREVWRALDGQTGKRKRRSMFSITQPDEEDENDEDPALSGEEELDQAAKPASFGPTTVHINEPTLPLAESASISSGPTTTVVAGGALQRNADGSVVAPRIGKKREKKDAFKSWKDVIQSKSRQVQEDSDTSFDSSDSAYDSSEEEFTGIKSDTDSSDQSPKSDGSEDESGQEEQEGLENNSTPAKRKLGFKDWALKQLNTAKGYEPAQTTGLMSILRSEDSEPPVKKRRITNPSQKPELRGPLGADLKLPETTFAERFGPQADSSSPNKVLVKRPPDVEEARILLPIVTEEQPIMEVILLNPVVIICGETGSGKTTQVPQFLYEAGFGVLGSENPGMIGVTQPRRVAAMSMAARVAHELSLTPSHVSYQIRYDATVSPNTSIKFMTDGVLLRELATDFLLSKYSVIIIDEAHERSMNTDILIGVLSRVLNLREAMWKEGKEGAKPLRLIIMSATLRVSDFAENRNLFPTTPPVINVAARQHPVTVHFSRRTSADYVTEAIKKTVKIHTRLPPGGILIFLTGQNEITGVCRKLEARFSLKAIAAKKKKQQLREQDEANDETTRSVMPAQADIEAEDLDLGEQPEDLAPDVDENMEDDPDALETDTEDELDEQLGLFAQDADMPMHVVPLYSLLANEKQMQVFQPPPEESRLVVVATNVAETSLTIPGIRYVVDCGRAKERRYDAKNGIQAFVVNWISKASAAQRAGRAGRTGPGHCYRLYSSALYEHHFDQFSLPEINRMPIEGVVLQMKSMHIDAVINFPFPSPPDQTTLRQAEKRLTHLGALSSPTFAGGPSTGGQITPLGKTMALFPLSPRFSRMLVSGQQHDCLPYIIAIVAALSVGDPFLHDEVIQQDVESDSEEINELSHLTSAKAKAKEAQRIRRKAYFESQAIHASLGQSSSDTFKVLSVVGAYEYARGGHQFCADHFVRPKAMEEIHKLRAQINNIVESNFPGVKTGFSADLAPPNALQLKVLKQLLTAGFIDQVAVRKDCIMDSALSGTQYTTSRGVPYRALGISEDVFIHPSSALASVSPPEYVIFTEVVQTTRVWLKGVTVTNPSWIATLGKPSLCSFSKPTKNMAGVMMAIPRFGPDGWELPPVKAKILG